MAEGYLTLMTGEGKEGKKDMKQRKCRSERRNRAIEGARERGVRVTDLLFDLSLTSDRPETGMWLPSGLAHHAVIPADLFLNVLWIMLLWLTSFFLCS